MNKNSLLGFQRGLFLLDLHLVPSLPANTEPEKEFLQSAGFLKATLISSLMGKKTGQYEEWEESNGKWEESVWE